MTTQTQRESMCIKGMQSLSVEEIGTGLFDQSLPHNAWTHEAHLAAAIYLLKVRPDLDARSVMPDLIRAFNEKNGVENSETSGFHATITEFYLNEIERFMKSLDSNLGPDAILCEVLAAPISRRDYPLSFYSREVLFSAKARAGYVEP